MSIYELLTVLPIDPDKRQYTMPWNRLPFTTLDTGFRKYRTVKRDENVEGEYHNLTRTVR